MSLPRCSFARIVCALFVGLVLFTAGEGLVSAASSAVQSPNVILIVTDDLGYGDLGSYGQARFETPRLDQFAAEGTRFINHYAGSPSEVASRAVLMTGKHSGHATIRGEGDFSLASLDVTLGDLAKQAGYHTAAIGKWSLGGPGSAGLPTVKGFDEWFGYLLESTATNHYPETLWRNQTNILWSGNSDGKREDYAPYLFTKAATNFVEMNKRRPFFLYLSYAVPGAPLQSPTDKPYKEKDWPAAQKTQAAMLYRLDREVGRLMDSLKHHGLDEKTVVLFTSDNGPHAEAGVDPAFFNSSGGLRGHKGMLTEGGLRVPLLVRWPGQIRAGRTSDYVCASWDLYPTIGHLMGLRDFDAGDGVSLTPELLRRRQSRRPFLYWERHDAAGMAQAIRSGDWKVVRSRPEGPVQLFNLKRDPGETKDVSGRYRRTARRLSGYFDEARTENADWPMR